MGELRKNFGRIRRILDIPNLIDIQNDSYRKFLQEGVDPEKRRNFGLQGAFHSVFPISDFSGKCSLEFVSYKIGAVRYDSPTASTLIAPPPSRPQARWHPRPPWSWTRPW